MLQVSGHDARVVRSVPVAPRRSRAELQPQADGLRRRLAGRPAEQRDRLASVPQQPLVDRPPPRAAGRRRVERIEHAAARLPAHERQRRPPEREVSRCAARRPAEHPRHQREPRRRIVAHGRDLRRRRGERVCVVAHRWTCSLEYALDRRHVPPPSVGEGRGAVPVGEVHVGAGVDQQTDGVGVGPATVAEDDRLEQRGPAEAVDVVEVDLGPQQTANDADMASLGRADEPGAVEAVLVIDVGARIERELEQAGIVADLARRDQVGALLGVVFGVDVGAVRDERAGGADLVAIGGGEELPIERVATLGRCVSAPGHRAGEQCRGQEPCDATHRHGAERVSGSRLRPPFVSPTEPWGPVH